MRIGNIFPQQIPQNTPMRLPDSAQQRNKDPSGIDVDISPKAWEAYKQGKTKPSGSIAPVYKDLECKTCSGRKYQDVSNDPSVSFQTPTHISPGQSAAAVAAHESEHVSNEKHNAEQDGREIISQTVTLSSSICPECKRVYISGGVTRTVSAKQVDIEA